MLGGLHAISSFGDCIPRPADSNCAVGHADNFSPLQLSDNTDVSFCFLLFTSDFKLH